MLAYLRLELVRMLRSPKLYIIAGGIPVALYLFITGVVASSDETNAVRLYFLVSMVCYGAVFSSVITTASGIVEERSTGWMRQLRIMPLPSNRVIFAKLLASMTLVLPTVAVVCAAAFLIRGVHLSAERWVLVVIALWISAVPFALFGLAIGYLSSPQISQAIGVSTSLGLTLLGGLFFSISNFPPALRHVARALPTYRYLDLGQRVVDGHLPTATDAAILLTWCVAFAVLAILGYRRTGRAA